jgi:hypothetical protein
VATLNANERRKLEIMTKHRDQQEKRFQDEAREKTKHDEVRERHMDAKVESGQSEVAPKKKSREDVNQAAARIVREAKESDESK